MTLPVVATRMVCMSKTVVSLRISSENIRFIWHCHMNELHNISKDDLVVSIIFLCSKLTCQVQNEWD